MFIENFLITPIDGDFWVVRDRLDWEGITVPIGFVTDLATVPRIFWSIIPRAGVYGYAAVIHDYLYRTATVNKKEADLIFLKIMTEHGVKRWKRLMMYWAVKFFGFIDWNRNRQGKYNPPKIKVLDETYEIPKIKLEN
jgi:hypothetical protein